MKNILVTIDFSDVTDLVIDRAGDLASGFGSTMRIMHVAPPDPAFTSSKTWPQEVRDELAKQLSTEHEQLEALARRLEERGLTARVLMDRGAIVDSILEVARRTETDVIVIGSRTQGAFFHLAPRSVVKALISRSSIPVLVVPQPKPARESEEAGEQSRAGEQPPAS